MTTPEGLEKTETPATTGIPAPQRPVITGNFGLGQPRRSKTGAQWAGRRTECLACAREGGTEGRRAQVRDRV